MSLQATYIYTDERGVPVLRKQRSSRKEFSMQAARYKVHVVGRREPEARLFWKGGPGCVQRWQPEWAVKAMYRLPELLDALKSGEAAVLVEGERDSDTGASVHKLATTTNWQGAGKFTAAQAEWFTYGGGRSKVDVLLDNDDAGHWAGWQRYSLLLDAGVKPKQVRLWRPASPDHKDLTDVTRAGLGGSAYDRVDPSLAHERADAYGAERAATYTLPGWVQRP